MNRPANIFGLLAISVVIVAAAVLLSRSLSEPQRAGTSGAVSASSSSSETSYTPCGSCDARHERLKKDRSGKD